MTDRPFETKIAPPVPPEVPEELAALDTLPLEEPQGATHERALEVEPEPARPTMQIDRKHPLAIRWMHWVNFPLLFTMIWSGLLIYWNDSIPGKGYAHQVYRVGIGKWTLFRLFPDWLYTLIHAPYNVTTGLGYHFFFMWLFAANGALYVLFVALSKEWKFLLPDRRSFAEAIQVTLVDLHVSKVLPPQKKYNGAQKIAYTSVILMGAGSLLTGVAIWKPAQAHLLTTVLGGYERARWEHFWLTMAFCGFFVLHIVQVALAGWNNFRSMVSGYELKRADEPSLEAERRTW